MSTTTLTTQDLHRTQSARSQAQALLDALLDAYAGNQRVSNSIPQSGRTAPALDVSRITLGRRIESTRQLIHQLDRMLGSTTV